VHTATLTVERGDDSARVDGITLDSVGEYRVRVGNESERFDVTEADESSDESGDGPTPDDAAEDPGSNRDDAETAAADVTGGTEGEQADDGDEGDDGDETGGLGPGFGVVAVMAALFAVLAAVALRR
jgi:hypothetical protein